MVSKVRLGAGAAAAVAVLASSAWVIAAHGESAPNVSLTATEDLGSLRSTADQLSVDGDTEVRLDVATLAGGGISVVAGPGGALDTALQFPAYVGTADYPRAVVGMTPVSGTALSPGADDFSWGAVLSVAARSQGRAVDNGNNVFQRGLANEKSQFKLEIDNRRPACTLKGAAGEALVRSGPIKPGSWYQVVCSRTGTTLTINVKPYGGRDVDEVRTKVSHATGLLTFAASRPASVGGKLEPSGSILSGASDQFNGSIARVWAERS